MQRMSLPTEQTADVLQLLYDARTVDYIICKPFALVIDLLFTYRI